jgi:sugar/nucleoside kinase (ribokinase family)
MITALSHPLVDIIVSVTPEFLQRQNLDPGSYGIVDRTEQDALLEACRLLPQTVSVGGSAANSAIAAQTLGVPSAMLGLIANDPLGQQVYQMLKTRGVLTPLPLITGERTGSCVSLITPDGERTMRTFLGVVKQLDHSHICEETIARSSWLLMEGYFLTAGEANTRALHRALSVAQNQKVKVAFTASAEFVVSSKRDEILTSVLPLTSMLLANEQEAMALTRSASPEEALAKLSLLAPSVVITLGEQGAIGCHHGEQWRIKSYIPHAPIVDTTGAGDVFAGAFLAGLVQGQPVAIAARGAARMASIVITQRGAHLPHEAHLHWKIETQGTDLDKR